MSAARGAGVASPVSLAPIPAASSSSVASARAVSVARPATSVVICAYTRRRRDDLAAAIESLRSQTLVPDEVVVVIDHNDALLALVEEEPGVIAVASTGPRGLSGARNTGVEVSTGDVVLFLDDDAVAEHTWVERMVAALTEHDAVGVGGWVEARWDAEGKPSWFPSPFLWVVGCSYAGLPSGRAEIRNPIGAAMAFRRDALAGTGGFSTDVGRVGSRPLGCEETELSIRIRQADPSAVIVLEPAAKVRHRVPAERATFTYFVRRCWYEGRSKRRMSGSVGSGDGLSAERAHLTRVLPRTVAGGLVKFLRSGRPAGLLQAGAMVAGVAAAAGGYLAQAASGVIAPGEADGPGGPGASPQ